MRDEKAKDARQKDCWYAKQGAHPGAQWLVHKLVLGRVRREVGPFSLGLQDRKNLQNFTRTRFVPALHHQSNLAEVQ